MSSTIVVIEKLPRVEETVNSKVWPSIDIVDKIKGEKLGIKPLIPGYSFNDNNWFDLDYFWSIFINSLDIWPNSLFGNICS